LLDCDEGVGICGRTGDGQDRFVLRSQKIIVIFLVLFSGFGGGSPREKNSLAMENPFFGDRHDDLMRPARARKQ
jgi:hypothetical protein